MVQGDIAGVHDDEPVAVVAFGIEYRLAVVLGSQIPGYLFPGLGFRTGAVFLVDPPYLSTEVGTYTMYWKLSDYLDVLTVLTGHSFIYFTSNKSSILELCEWIGKNQSLGNPFKGCMKSEFNAHINYNATYTDIMLYKRATPTIPAV